MLFQGETTKTMDKKIQGDLICLPKYCTNL